MNKSYEEKAKEILKHLSFWKRLFMSRKRKNRFIKRMCNIMEMTECSIDHDYYKKLEKKYNFANIPGGAIEQMLYVVAMILLESSTNGSMVRSKI